MSFRLTYATMFNPPEEMHERFEKALAKMRGELGKTHPMYVDGKDVPAAVTEERASPIDNNIKIGRFPQASEKEVDAAIAAAERAFAGWRDAGALRRVELMRKVARILEERVYDIAAALVLEVGKNRLEALGEAQECVDFFDVYAADFESHKGYEFDLPNDPSTVFVSRNKSVMRPYGVWAVNFDVVSPIGVASTDELAVFGWDDTRNSEGGPEGINTEFGAGVQDIFAGAAQFEAIGGGGWPVAAKVIVAAVAGLAVVALCLLLAATMAKRGAPSDRRPVEPRTPAGVG